MRTSRKAYLISCMSDSRGMSDWVMSNEQKIRVLEKKIKEIQAESTRRTESIRQAITMIKNGGSHD